MPLPVAEVYRRLYTHYGPQHWWPADSPFEVMVGAVLTQNTAWSNVERAIANLRRDGLLDARAISVAEPTKVAESIRPSGYFNIKAKRLANLCRWYLEQGGVTALQRLDTPALRHALLGVNGVGYETADDILLYAFSRPVFVVDAYTRRLFSRLGLVEPDIGYEPLRHTLEQALAGESDAVSVYNEFHALIVAHAKVHCLKRARCADCPLRVDCSGPVEE